MTDLPTVLALETHPPSLLSSSNFHESKPERSSLSKSIPPLDENTLEKASNVPNFNSREFIPVFFGLALAFLLATLDMTIIAPALPSIASSFNSLSQVTWVATSYFVTENTFQPTFGKFSDIFGRKVVLFAALFIFTAGSIICGASQSLLMLISGRALQGLGGGGLHSLTYIIIADLVPLEIRGKYQAIFGSVYIFSSIIGPLLGGWLTDAINWRWNFWINIPLGAIVLIIFAFTLRLPTPAGSIKSKLKKVDVIGTVLLVGSVLCLLLCVEWAMKEFPWSNIAVWGLFILAVLLAACFIMTELRVKEPLMPMRLYRNRNIWLSSLLAFFAGIPLYGLIIYIPNYYQIFRGMSATRSGLSLLTFMIFAVIVSVVAGSMVVKRVYFRSFIFMGFFITMISALLLALRIGYAVKWEEMAYIGLAGIGVGFFIETIILVSIASVSDADMAVTISLISFWQSTGGVIGLAATDTVLQSIYSSRLISILGSQLAEQIGGNIKELDQLPKEQLQSILAAYLQAIRVVWWIYVPLLGIACAFTLLLRPPKKLQ